MSFHDTVMTTVLNEPSRLSVWTRQLRVVFKIELFKSIFSKRTLSTLLLSLLPTLLIILISFNKRTPTGPSIGQMREIFGYIFSVYILAAVIFLGSAIHFTAAFRGEILQRNLHYYFLTPIRRELLVLGKFSANLVSSLVVISVAVISGYLLMYLPFGANQLMNDLSAGIVLGQIAAYLGIALLACMSYGAVFMTTGLLFRSPLIPVAVVAGWEAANFFMPPFLKMFSIIHYLKGLLPIPLNEGVIAIIVAPPPARVSIIGMVSLTAIALLVSSYILKRLEIRYTEE